MDDSQLIAERIKEWLASPDGVARINAAVEDAQAASAELMKSREVTDDMLNAPMTL